MRESTVYWHSTNVKPAPRDGRRFLAKIEGVNKTIVLQYWEGKFVTLNEPFSLIGRAILEWTDMPL